MTGGPRFRHLDDLEWQEVRRQQHGERIAMRSDHQVQRPHARTLNQRLVGQRQCICLGPALSHTARDANDRTISALDRDRGGSTA